MPTLRIAQDDAADELLIRDPLALVVGMMLDQYLLSGHHVVAADLGFLRLSGVLLAACRRVGRSASILQEQERKCLAGPIDYCVVRPAAFGREKHVAGVAIEGQQEVRCSLGSEPPP